MTSDSGTRVEQDDDLELDEQEIVEEVFCEECGKIIEFDDEIVMLVMDTFDAPMPFHRGSCEDKAREVGLSDPPVFIAKMANILGRYEHTVRRWVRESEKIFVLAGFVPPNQGLMPQDLWPEREPEGRKRIWWRADQVDELKRFADMKESRRGWHGASRAS